MTREEKVARCLFRKLKAWFEFIHYKEVGERTKIQREKGQKRIVINNAEDAFNIQVENDMLKVRVFAKDGAGKFGCKEKNIRIGDADKKLIDESSKIEMENTPESFCGAIKFLVDEWLKYEAARLGQRLLVWQPDIKKLVWYE